MMELGEKIFIITGLIILELSLTNGSGGYEWSCCPPCGGGIRLQLHGDLSYRWFAKDCDSLVPSCPLFSYRGCWNVPDDLGDLAEQIKRKNGGSFMNDGYDNFPATECALMSRASGFVYFTLHNSICYGTNNTGIFGRGPTNANCNEHGGTENTMGVYVFPECGDDYWDNYLKNEDMCVSDRIAEDTFQEANRSCTAYNSSLVTFREFSQIVNSGSLAVEPGKYWLSDDENPAKCANYSLTYLNMYNCDSSDSESHLYYCKLPTSQLVGWMSWQSWSDCDSCSGRRQRVRYRLSINAIDRVDIDVSQCIAGNCSATTMVSTSIHDKADVASTVFTTGRKGVETDVTTDVKAIIVTSTDTGIVTDAADDDTDGGSTTEALGSAAVISATEAASALDDLTILTRTGFGVDEVFGATDMLLDISQNLNVTSSADAELVITSVSEFVNALTFNQSSSWEKTNKFVSVLDSVEVIVTKCASAMTNSYRMELPNINIVTEKVLPGMYNVSSYELDLPGASAKVTLPTEAFTGSQAEPANLVVIVYEGVDELFRAPTIKDEGDDSVDWYDEIGEVVLSMSLTSVSHTRRLKNPIAIQLPVNISSQPRLNGSMTASNNIRVDPRCVFWNTSAEKWSFDGCQTAVSGDHVTCRCNHLTSFAVLLRYTEFRTDEDSHEGQALTLIGQIGCAVSLICLLITIVIFIYLDNLKTERKNIHMNLIVALGLAQITHVVGIDMTYDRVACISIAALLHLFYTATFTWMLCEGLQLYFKIVAVFNSESKSKRVLYYLLGWGVPALIVGVSMAIQLDGYGTDSFCWLSTEDGLIWAFVGPVCAVIFINLCIMFIVIKIVVTSTKAISSMSKNRDNLAVVRAGVKGVVILTPLLGINWLFGLLAVNEHLIVFEFLFVILNSFQGVFIFLFHCVGSSEVRAAFNLKREQSSRSKSANNSTSKPTNGFEAKDSWVVQRFSVTQKIQGNTLSIGAQLVSDMMLGKVGPNLGGLKHMTCTVENAEESLSDVLDDYAQNCMDQRRDISVTTTSPSSIRRSASKDSQTIKLSTTNTVMTDFNESDGDMDTVHSSVISQFDSKSSDVSERSPSGPRCYSSRSGSGRCRSGRSGSGSSGSERCVSVSSMDLPGIVPDE